MLRFLLLLSLTVLPVCATEAAWRDQIAELFRQRQWTEARGLLEKITTEEPGNAAAWNSLGLAHLALQDTSLAISAFEKAVALEPTQSDYILQAGHAYGLAATKAGLFAKLGFARKCKAAYDKAVALDPASINARWSLMEFCRQAPEFLGGGMTQAYGQAEAIRQLDARRGRSAYAALYVSEKKYAEAFAVYDEALRTQPADADSLFHVGRLAAESGQQLDRGLAALRQVLTQPDRAGDARIHTLIGRILEKQGDKAGAQSAYEAALAGDPTFTQALESLRKLKAGLATSPRPPA